MESKAALEVSDLTVFYGQNQMVLWDIDLQVPRGALMAVVGPNGAGKSTFLKSVLSLTPKASGEVLVDGKPYNPRGNLVGYVPQRNSVDWDFPVTVLDVVMMSDYRNIGFFRRATKRSKERATEALTKVGMEDYLGRQISELSGGQQQRTFLARALMQDASLYLMDEPFAGVDSKTEKAIAAVFKSMQQQKKTLVVVHHDLGTLREYFNHLTLLNKVVVASGPINSVLTPENLKRTYEGRLEIGHPFYDHGQSNPD